MSRSEQKRRVKQLEGLVAELCSLPSVLIEQLPCDEEFRVLFRDAAAMSGGVRNRHVKYITKLLRDEPVEELYAFLSARKGRHLQEKKEFQEAEYLRDALLNEAIEEQQIAEHDQRELEENWNSRVAEEICGQYPGIDKALLTRLGWLYARTRNRRHSRELFRIVRAAHEQSRMLKKNE